MPNRLHVRNYGGATGAVGRWLQKADPDYGLRDVWQRMSLDSLENFTRDVKAWLGDRSELRSSTIDRANYAELFPYFRGLKDLPPLEEPPAAPQPKMVQIPGLGRSIAVNEPAAPTKTVPTGLGGLPAARYAVEVDGEPVLYWVKRSTKGDWTKFAQLLRREGEKWAEVIRKTERDEAVRLIKTAPLANAKRYGEITRTCSECGRKLSREDSLSRMMGRDCALKLAEKINALSNETE
jgi:hypothetical protein